MAQSSQPTKEVSFLEFVQVASATADDLGNVSGVVLDYAGQGNSLERREPRCSLTDNIVHYEPLRPPAAMSMPMMVTPATLLSSSAGFSSAAAATTTTTTTAAAAAAAAAFNVFLSSSSCSSVGSNSPTPTLISLDSFRGSNNNSTCTLQASTLPPPTSIAAYCMASGMQCSFDLQQQQSTTLPPPGAFCHHPGGGVPERMSSGTTPPLRQLVQFWPGGGGNLSQAGGNALSVIPEAESPTTTTSMLQVTTSFGPLLTPMMMLGPQPQQQQPHQFHHHHLVSPEPQALTVISKSSSSDSDTNDSAARLLPSADNTNTLVVVDTMHHQHQNNPTSFPPGSPSSSSLAQSSFILPDVLQDTKKETTEFAAENNNNNDNWIPMQSDLSKNIRENYLRTQKRPKRTREEKRKSFTFHRFGVGRFGFVCPLKRSTARKLCLLTVAMLIISGLATFLGLCWWSNQWPPLLTWLTGGAGDDGDRRYGLDSDPHWWRGTTFYHIFPASFKDTDGDGYGDFEGVRSKVAYLRSLGVSTVRLASIFAAIDYPQRTDTVVDFKMVDPHLGRQDDFLRLVDTLHANHIRVVLDWNPTLTSEKHPWASKARRDRENASIEGGGEFARFYESLGSGNEMAGNSSPNPLELPSVTTLRLNWSHEAVRQRLLKVAEFWLRTVDGLYVSGLENAYVELEHTRTQVLHSFLASLQTVAQRAERRYRQQHRGSRWAATKVLITPSSLVDNFIVKRRRRQQQEPAPPAFDELELPVDEQQQQQQLNFNFHVMPSHNRTTGRANATKLDRTHRRLYNYFHLVAFDLRLEVGHVDSVRDQVNNVYLNSPSDFPLALWSLSDMHRPRLATRLGSAAANRTAAAHFLLSILPGSVCLFYGDEIGLVDVYDRHSGNKYRNGQLTPMAWTSQSPNGNFSLLNVSSGQLWLPASPDYAQVNAERRAGLVRLLGELNHFRLEHLYIESSADVEGNNHDGTSAGSSAPDVKITPLNKATSLAATPTISSMALSSSSFSDRVVNYLFHYIDGSIICLEQYFDRKIDLTATGAKSKRFRFVLFANFGDEVVVRDFSDKFRYSSIQLATDRNRTSQFLILPSLQLSPGEALIALVE